MMTADPENREQPTLQFYHVIVALCFALCPVMMLLPGPIASLGDSLAAAAAVIGLIFALASGIYVGSFMIGLSWFILLAIYALSLAVDPNFQALKSTMGVLTIGGLVIFHMKFGGMLLASRVYRITTTILAGVALFLALVSPLSKNVAAGIAIYAMLLMVSSLIWRGNRVRALFVVISCGAFAAQVAFVFQFRAMIGYSVIFVGAYLVGLVLPRRLFSWTLLCAMIGIAVALIWFYLNINSTALGLAVNEFLFHQSGRTALSGREVLWPMIVGAIEKSPYWGWGAGKLPWDFFSTPYSAHNYYLQMTLQVGLVGLTALIIFLFSIWRRLNASEYASHYSLFASSVFFLLVIHNCTEVNMMQNQMNAAIPAWIVISCALSAATPVRKPKRTGSIVRPSGKVGHGDLLRTRSFQQASRPKVVYAK